MKNRDLKIKTIENIPVFINHDHTKLIGWLKMAKPNIIKQDECFSVGYVDKEDGSTEIIEISLVKDKDYKKFLDGGLSNAPLGYRDVYWCPSFNEPVIVEYKNDKAYCSLCKTEMNMDTYQFICHIVKPKTWKK